MPYHRTVTRTIRLGLDLDRALEELAGKEKVSVNLLITRVLRRHVDWDNNASKFGFVATSSSTLRRIMEYLSEDEVREHGQWVGKNLSKEFVTFFFKTISFDNVLRTLQLLGSDYAGQYQYEQHFDGKTHTVICKHNRGFKWSMFYQEAFKHMFKELLGVQIGVQASEDQVILHIRPVDGDESRGQPDTGKDPGPRKASVGLRTLY